MKETELFKLIKDREDVLGALSEYLEKVIKDMLRSNNQYVSEVYGQNLIVDALFINAIEIMKTSVFKVPFEDDFPVFINHNKKPVYTVFDNDEVEGSSLIGVFNSIEGAVNAKKTRTKEYLNDHPYEMVETKESYKNEEEYNLSVIEMFENDIVIEKTFINP